LKASDFQEAEEEVAVVGEVVGVEVVDVHHVEEAEVDVGEEVVVDVVDVESVRFEEF